MKKIFAAALAIALIQPFGAFAASKTVVFPSDAPVASIAIPESWSPEETETGIEATSDDGAIYLSIDVADERTSDKVIDDAVAFLQGNGVNIDGSTQKQSEDEINGMKMANFDWSGTDKDGPVSVGLSVVSPKPGKLLVITYWGTKGEQEKHGPALLAIINSLHPAGQ
ncbi:histidine kinase [Rhizobium sp. FY34]|uniref:histidine kinase n=1 Tax=Rhizobium sp. FY34 TaxID=2562309 RepID=UPI00148532F1|nr:histidine kinase [Rhizobium sp. FY34]